MTETLPHKSLMNKPDENTPFHIDFELWKKSDPNWKNYLIDSLCEIHKAWIEKNQNIDSIDLVNPETGEISQADALLNLIYNHCAQQNGFIPKDGTITDTIFRILLQRQNKSISVHEISKIINRPEETILRTIGGKRIYKGIVADYTK